MSISTKHLRLLCAVSLVGSMGACKVGDKKHEKPTPANQVPADGEKQAAEGKDHGDNSTSTGTAVAVESEAASGKIAFDAPFDGEWEERHELRNGLVMEDYVVGTGEPASKGSAVEIHYTGYLTDGSIFDSSVKKGRPPFRVTLGEGRVIQGWEKGLIGMKVGGKRKLTIPSALGYGASSRPKIPADSTLVFTLEMTGMRAPYKDPKPAEVFEQKPVNKQKLEGKLEVIDYAIGEGDLAEAGDTVAVHYTGMLDDGTVFDSSVPRKSPIEFPLGRGRVIKGWDLGIAGMKVGGLRRLIIPADLGYGDRDLGKIPPKSRLTFTVELMGVDKPVKPAESATEKKPEEAAKSSDSKPAEQKPEEKKSADAKPADAKPADEKAADAKPEAAAAQAKPADEKAADAKPAEAAAEAKPAAEEQK